MSQCIFCCQKKIPDGIAAASLPGFSRTTGKVYESYDQMCRIEGLRRVQNLGNHEKQEYLDLHWFAICKGCYKSNVKLPSEFRMELPKKFKVASNNENKQREIISNPYELKSKLINCPDCERKVSKRAAACPNCGCPIVELDTTELETQITDEAIPNLSTDLGIGPAKIFELNTSAMYKKEDNTIGTIEPGKVRLVFHNYGIAIHKQIPLDLLDLNPFCIHYSQIIKVEYADRSTLIKYAEQEKSVIGRAIAGALIAGPVGAIVGGMSGIGTKKIIETDYLIINFWHLDNDKVYPQSILLCGKKKRRNFEKIASEIHLQTKR